MDGLNFKTGFVRLLEYLTVPAAVIQNGVQVYSNSLMKNLSSSGENCLSELLSPADDAEESYISLCGSTYKVRISGNEKSGCMMLRINNGGTPADLVITDFSCGRDLFHGCVEYINTGRMIKRLLIVDDNPLVLETFDSIFEMLGYSTSLFTSPVTALEQMDSLDFDLMVTDYNMPGMDGFELVKYLNRIKPGIPAIICSGLIDLYRDLLHTLDPGQPVLFMDKPLTINKLTGALEVMELFYGISRYCREIEQ